MSTVAYEAPAGAPSARNRKGTAAMALLLIMLLAIGGALAYLTDHKTVINDLALDTDLSIELTEPQWDAARDADPEYAKHLVPTETAVKDPTVTCTGTVPAYAAVKVKVPVFTGKVFDQAAGTIADISDGDLFAIAWEDGWTLKETSGVEDGFRTYTYLWPTVLGKGDSAKVFGSVTVANLIEGVGIDATQITVDAFGIQAEGFADADAAWAGYTHQEGDGAGEVPDPGPEPDEPVAAGTLSAAKVNAAVPDTTATVVFSATAQPDGDDLTVEGNGAITGTASDDTYTIANAAGGTIMLPEDCSEMFSRKESIHTIDFTAADSSRVSHANHFASGTSLTTAITGEKWSAEAIQSSASFMPNTMAADDVVVAPHEVFPNASSTYTPARYSQSESYMMDNQRFRTSTLFDSLTTIAFTDTPAPEGAETTDVSRAQDGSVVIWNDEAADTTYCSTQTDGRKVVAPPYVKGEGLTPFYNCSSTMLDARMLDVSRANCMRNYFYMSQFKTIDITGWDTRNVTDMSEMFSRCGSLVEVKGLNGIDTGNVTSMYCMFGSTPLASLDLSSFDTRNVVYMSSMFSGCYKLASLDLSSFDTRNVVYMSSMFSGCGKLETIFASGDWDVSKAGTSAYNATYGPGSAATAFGQNESLVGGAGTAYSASGLLEQNGESVVNPCRIDHGASRPGYFTLKA